MNQFSRTELLLRSDNMKKIKDSNILVFGVGGVGGYAVEALARCGVGSLTLVDNDEVALTNINRQIIATLDTIGKAKVHVFKDRIASISPETKVNAIKGFYLPEKSTTKDSKKDFMEDPKVDSQEDSQDNSKKADVLTYKSFDFSSYDYVIDAIDTVAAKLDIIEKCTNAGTPIISAMGCGNRLDPTKLVVTDIHKTEMDPLAKVIRKELRQRGIKKLKVVASTEQPIKPAESDEITNKRTVPGSTSFVPPTAGLIIASEVIREICNL